MDREVKIQEAEKLVNSLVWPQDEKAQSTLIISQVKELAKNSFIKGFNRGWDIAIEEEREFAKGEAQRELALTPKFDRSIQFAEWLRINRWRPDEETKGWFRTPPGKMTPIENKSSEQLNSEFISYYDNRVKTANQPSPIQSETEVSEG